MFDHKRYIVFSHCRAILPWFSYARKTDPTSRFRRLVAEAESPIRHPSLRYQLIAAVLYFFSSIRQGTIAMRDNVARTRREHGLGYFTQFVDLVYWTMRLNHHPYAYYNQHIGIRRDRRNWRHYIDHREQCLFLSTYSQPWDASICLDKRSLFVKLRAKGVPVIDILLSVENAKLNPDIGVSATDEDFAYDLIMKPVDGQQEENIEYWRFLPTSRRHQFFPHMLTRPSESDIYEREVSRDDLVEHFIQRSQLRPFILQRWLKNHASIEPICPHYIANFRLVTTMIDGEITLSSAIMRLGFDRCAQWPNATYVSNIDRKTGILGPATSCFPEFGYSDFHVETGNVVAGRQLEGWSEIKRVALLGHACAPSIPNIGWDIIHTESKVMIMEGNLYFGADIVQIAGPLLGETNYAKANLEGIREVTPD